MDFNGHVIWICFCKLEFDGFEVWTKDLMGMNGSINVHKWDIYTIGIQVLMGYKHTIQGYNWEIGIYNHLNIISHIPYLPSGNQTGGNPLEIGCFKRNIIEPNGRFSIALFEYCGGISKDLPTRMIQNGNVLDT